MTTVSKTFTATGDGTNLAVKQGDKFTYQVSGTFSGTVLLQRSVTSGQSWETTNTFTAISGPTTVIAVGSTQGAHIWFRFICSAFVSGSIVTSIAAPFILLISNS